MRIFLLACFFLLMVPVIPFCQNIGIGTASPHSSAVLDITNTNKGLLIPRMTGTGITAIPNPAKGLMVYDSVNNQLLVNMGTPVTPNWQTIVAKSGWGLNGNSGVSAANQFIGTTDNQPLRLRVNNTWAGEVNPSSGNIYLGVRSGQSTTTGSSNVAFGTDALKLNTTGSNNTATGYQSLFFNTIGQQNTANGYQALYSNTSGNYNIAIGIDALYFNTTGGENTANGIQALFNNTQGSYNTANGFNALISNTSGINNTANGANALYSNNTGYGNTSMSYNALLYTSNSAYNTAIGYNSASTHDLGYNNTILGANCDAAFSGAYNDIAIGQAVTCTDNSQARIGNSATYSIGGYANWTNISDGRYKKNLKENVQGLAFVMKLRPVTYNLDITGLSNKLNESRGKEMNTQMRAAIAEKEQVVQTGFVAQEVEQAAAAAGYAFSGVDKPRTDAGLYGLRYSEFVVPLVKAVQEQQQMIMDMKKRIETLEEQTKLLQQLLNRKN